MSEKHKQEFIDLMSTVTQKIAGLPVDAALENRLNHEFPAGGPFFNQVLAACKAGVDEGWMCAQEHGGIRFGRIAKPSAALHGFSIDVVDMHDIVGPHHTHPNGEIDLIMPLDGEPEFDGHIPGWMVYSAGSAHKPTVRGGRAYILYLLPEGAIEFTRNT